MNLKRKTKGFEDVSEAIIFLAILIIVAVSVAVTYVLLREVETPKDMENYLSGNPEELSENIAGFADACWRKHSSLSRNYDEDCFVLYFNSPQIITREHIVSKLSGSTLPLDKLICNAENCPVPKDTDITLKISYNDALKEIEIKIV